MEMTCESRLPFLMETGLLTQLWIFSRTLSVSLMVPNVLP